ncbi:MAG: TRAP transporter small permease subunit [Mesorhizobium sp.]|nr:TRAP transporter small permease subunit [Mesorhizobium sp. M5C.F.Cr.IN.023.01.1.1]RWF82675.1 MAG: TRAP transporter small permease subunit [Mesorhizobium sp.]RWF94273.1 MAG: TRAP transporter small permease subunit [Mesorhizobium sp.]RWI33248.1 MAG: TRAP transporter small permease subunit [Mesorhizobium sp.]RWI42958.1 MAG: TRAP transporter small permease subunit [Mesorhizobium sp.]
MGAKMLTRAIRSFIRGVEAVNRVVGLFSMYLIFIMIGVLLYSSIMKTFSIPPLWTLEMAQFLMIAYFMLGGGYSLIGDSHVRMDLWYGRWSLRGRARVDIFTVVFLVVYLGFMLHGGFSSSAYALRYGETSYSSWGPYMAPIKIVMCVGIFLMLLQAIAEWLKDIAAARGGSVQ